MTAVAVEAEVRALQFLRKRSRSYQLPYPVYALEINTNDISQMVIHPSVWISSVEPLFGRATEVEHTKMNDECSCTRPQYHPLPRPAANHDSGSSELANAIRHFLYRFSRKLWTLWASGHVRSGRKRPAVFGCLCLGTSPAHRFSTRTSVESEEHINVFNILLFIVFIFAFLYF